MMFGYATNETENLMPLKALDISHKILIELSRYKKERRRNDLSATRFKISSYLEYNDDHSPKRITDIVVSTRKMILIQNNN